MKKITNFLHTFPPLRGAGGLLLAIGLLFLSPLGGAGLAAQTNHTVSNTNDSGPGSLRQAITYNNADGGGGTIYFAPELAGQTITLASGLPTITQSVTIEGSGITLTGNNQFRLLAVSASGKDIAVRRVHFTQGSSAYGGAVYHLSGTLTFESCIFSHNATDGDGGAINNNATLAVRGCTFYHNTAGQKGGAIYVTGSTSTATLTGNLFYGNAATQGGDVIYVDSATATSGGCNLYDRASYGFAFSYWGDTQVTEAQVTQASFRPLAGRTIATKTFFTPSEFPLFDFYGTPVDGAVTRSGAVQTVNTAPGWMVDHAAWGNGTVSVSGATPDAEGLYAEGSTVTLTAIPGPGAVLEKWIIDGADFPAAPTLTLSNLSAHRTVRAQFSYDYEVSSALDDGSPGTLRHAVGYINGNHTATPATITVAPALRGQTLTLASALPTIARSFALDGNGIILSGGDAYRIFTIYADGHTADIRRVHFTGGSGNGSAIFLSEGTLAFASCIFSGNAGGAYGDGAIYSYGTLTVGGCTFYNNTARNGGAIYVSDGTATLTGNLFYGNTATSGSGHVISKFNSSAVTVTSGGYNVYDNTSSNFSFGQSNVDVSSSGLAPLDPATFAPLNGARGMLPSSLPTGYPTTDFNGATISAGGDAGAVQAAAAQTTYTVSNTNDSGAGSLRQAITDNNDAGVGGTITVDPTLAGQTITLASLLPTITQSVTIEGGGITLSGNGQYRPLLVNASGKDITVRRVHFTQGSGVNGGAVSHSNGMLTLESCIFSRNVSTSSGGAIYSYGTLTVRGCTFYNNTTRYGGAIYVTGTGATATLTGNLFYGNAAELDGDVIAVNSTTATAVSGGYNLYDRASYGFAFDPSGDTQVTEAQVTQASFHLLAGRTIATKTFTPPAGYPATDFYGEPIPAAAARSGAVQTVTTATGWMVDAAAWGNGTVVISGATPDAEGLYPASATVTLTAIPGPGAVFEKWIVNGADGETTPLLMLAGLFANNTVRAQFSYNYEVSSTTDDGSPGSLRHAVGYINGNRTATPAAITVDPTLGGQTLTLASTLPTIVRSFTLDGNGIILSGGGTYRILNINAYNHTVDIRRVHFTEGRGSAIYLLDGTLALASCIFNGNTASGSGTINSYSTLTVSGCTFYNNTAGTGGAIFVSNGTTTLTGNLFYGNTATSGPGHVISKSITGSSNATINSGGYNVYDNTSNGFSFGTSDVDVSSGLAPLDPATFAPLNGALGMLPSSLPLGYPTTDFNGATISAGGDAGAVQATVIVVPTFGLSFAITGPGNVTADQPGAQYAENDLVTLTLAPATHYTLESISAFQTGNSGNTLTLAGTGTGTGDTRTFTMPAYAVTIAASFYNLDSVAIATAKGLIEGASFGAVAQATANDEASIKAWLVQQINTLIGQLPAMGITVSDADITLSGLTPAANGTDGSYGFTVALTLPGYTGSASQTGLTITATAVVVTPPPTPPATTYTVTLSATTNGTVSASPSSAAAGERITLTLAPSDGYELASLTAVRTSGASVTLSGTGNVHTFTMPAADVTVSATFRKTQEQLDREALADALTGIETGTFRVAQMTANASDPLRIWLINTLNYLYGNVHGVGFRSTTAMTGDVTITSVTPAIAGTEDHPQGTNGAFTFTVKLTRGSASATTAPTNGTIVALPYGADTKNVEFLNLGELAVRIINTGNVATGKLSLALRGNGAGSFSLLPATLDGLGVGAEADIMLVPAAGLAPGHYTLTLTASADGMEDVSTAITYSTFAVGTEDLSAPRLRVSATDGGLQISGLTPGDPLRVYNMQGQLLYNGKATMTTQHVYLRSRGIYVVTDGSQTVKAVY